MPRALTHGWQSAAHYEAEIGRCPECQLDLRHGRAFSFGCSRCAEREDPHASRPNLDKDRTL